MNAKDYLLQARYLDERITSKTQQIASLNDLATRCTSTFSDMPRNPNHGSSRLEDCIIKIIDLEDSLKKDIEKLVDLKREIMVVIKAVPNVEYQTLLDMINRRYDRKIRQYEQGEKSWEFRIATTVLISGSK